MAKVDVRLFLIVFFSFQRWILAKQQRNVDSKSEDTIDVDLWNRFNHEDMEKMPKVDDFSDEMIAINWLRWYSRISERYYQISVHLEWQYKTNLTDENQKKITKQNMIASSFHHLSLPMAKKFNEFTQNSDNEDLKRIFHRLAQGYLTNDQEILQRSSLLHAQLENIYSTAKVCQSNDTSRCYQLSPDLERFMQVEKDYDRLLWAWQGWHDSSGDAVRPVYLSYIDLLMKISEENSGKNLAEHWIESYEMGPPNQFEQSLDTMLQSVMPLYNELHGFVRGRLCEKYSNRFDCDGSIPAHLLGNMWAQQWHDRLDDLLPYPDAPLVNLTKILQKKHYTIDRLYRTAEDFFTSIDLFPMSDKFWSRSLFVKPDDREVVCHPSASNMDYHDDYRVKICTVINEDYFYTIHHEMGHIEYYMAYARTQPFVYRDGANSAFHEAIGDTIGMFAISPNHLLKLGFIDETHLTQHYEMNYLMRLALQKVAFLPFAYVMDKYRFALFRRQIDRENELNRFWWNLRTKYSGIRAPVDRDDPKHFDAGAKYHVSSNVPYARYFLAHVLQFQFHRALCQLQGNQDRWHMCDIYGNEKVGQRFRRMLSMGSSKHWSEVLEYLTGENQVKTDAILDFFQPLYQWLKSENLARGYTVGWL